MKLVSIAGFTNLGYRLHANSFVPLEANLAGKTAVVTGATGGIGAETALRLGKLGARVVVVARSPEKVASTVSGIPDAVGYSADLSLMSEIRRLADELVTNETAVDILVNNVGALFPSREVTGEGLERTLATNLAGPANVCWCAARHMIGAGGGHIVNVSSRGAFRGEPDAPAYGASKAGLNALSQSLAVALAPHGIFVGVVAPGFVETDMAARLLDGETGDAIRAQSPLGRVAKPGEVAAAVLFLASEDAAFATGTIIDVNGASYLRS